MVSRATPANLDGLIVDALTPPEELPPEIFATLPAGGPRAALASAVAGALSARRRRAARRLARDAELPAAGEVVGRYRIEEVVGAGGFAVVYRATHLVLQVPVAIKMLQPEVVRRHPHVAQVLAREARYAARVHHPNVARVHDAYLSSRLSYVVMEHIDGCTLSDAARPGAPLPPEAVLTIGLDVAAGLSAALAQGLVHRDVKPSNILLTRAGEAKLVDFGLARRHGSPPAERLVSRSVVGTPGYMAPEQEVDPEAVDHRADIYALAVTMCEAAGGQPGAEPASIAPLLVRMLARDPGQRPADYRELVAEIERARVTCTPRRG